MKILGKDLDCPYGNANENIIFDDVDEKVVRKSQFYMHLSLQSNNNSLILTNQSDAISPIATIA